MKQTRPQIVDANPEMGALLVMQEVGKQWQSLTDEQRNYFKEKADKDKVRYLDEQRAFYDEVERIGQERGTVTTKEGLVIVAETQHKPASEGNKSAKKNKVASAAAIKQGDQPSLVQDTEEDNQSLLEKRKSANQEAGDGGPNRRIKTEEKKESLQLPTSALIAAANQHILGSPNNNNNHSQLSSNDANQPKKPSSSYVFFSQEFREIVRSRFGQYLSPQQIMKAVTFKWQSLTKDQRAPFDAASS